jgi:superfamily I DNA and RNA helicase
MSGTWWVSESDLDDDQKDIIGLGADGSYLVIGPPGSGKTNLLLLRAKYLCLADKPDVKILVFTRALREFIASGADNYAFSKDKVQTYHSWAANLLAENGVEVERSGDFDVDRKRLLSQLSDLVRQQDLRELHDVILLDEAHDYLLEEVRIIRRLATCLFAVADARQQIYNKGCPVDGLSSLVDKTYSLKYHYRNGLQICRLADGIMKGKGRWPALEKTSNYDENLRPSRVAHYRCSSIGDQCERIVKEIEAQRSAYPDELIGVICPRREELEQLRFSLLASPVGRFCVFQDTDSGFAPIRAKGAVCVSTLHAAKGLEFRALHFAACDTLKSFGANRNMAFTAVTRAKTSLSLYYCDPLFGYLEKALAALFPSGTKPHIAHAFGPKGN